MFLRCISYLVKKIDKLELFDKISMDGFGSGFSSLNLLSEMPLDIIKLDRCFLHSDILQKKEKIVISNIIKMTKELEMLSKTFTGGRFCFNA